MAMSSIKPDSTGAITPPVSVLASLHYTSQLSRFFLHYPMAPQIQSIRGMHDALPENTPLLRSLENRLRQVLISYGYEEIRMPIVEHTELFSRSIGEVTDIVEKEMYTFADRNGDSLTLRPEGTASCVRAAIQHGLLHNQQQRLWYMGPFFRHERPQKGRYRQFYQLGVETFGIASPDIDAELIIMTAQMWNALGIHDIRLELNSLGSPESRALYREELIRYLEQYRDLLDEDARHRLYTNPLRILDSKNPQLIEIVANAPDLAESLDIGSRAHHEELMQRLNAAGIPFTENPHLVRGLDYYTRTVFEWISDELGAQGTLCAGGRYDGLVEQLGGRATPAAGFAIGLERLQAILESRSSSVYTQPLDAYMVMADDDVSEYGCALSLMLRKAMPGLSLRVNCGGGSFKAQLKRADKSGALLALIIGIDEMEKETVTVKLLRDKSTQFTLPQTELVAALPSILTR